MQNSNDQEHKTQRKFENIILNIILDIERYCEENNSWPIEFHKPVSAVRRNSRRLKAWLSKSNYSPENNNFKYNAFTLPDGTPVKEFLDRLYNKYYIPDNKSPEHTKDMVNDIIVFCLIYNKWPNQKHNPQSKEDELANQLSSWLYRTRYYEGEEFKFKDIPFIGHFRVKEVLDFFFFKYGASNPRFSYYKKLAAQVENDKIYELYNNILKLSEAVYVSFEVFDLYHHKIESLINELGIDLTFNDIIKFLKLPPLKQQEIYKISYQVYSIANNNALAYLYHLLYANSVLTEDSLKRTRKLKK